MKKMLLIISAIFFVAFVAQSQADKTKPAAKPTVHVKQAEDKRPPNPNAAVIDFEKTIHDYGTLEQHGDGHCEFAFTNKGKEPLILTNVRSSCGCTVPQWPKQPILPGESEKIKVKYDTKRVGVINKSVTVYSNATTGTVVLKIKGKINAKPKEQIPTKITEGSGAPINK